MASDDLGLDPNAAAAPAAAPVTPAAAPEALTAEQVAGALNQALAPLQEAVQGLGGRLDTLDQRTSVLTDAATPAPVSPDASELAAEMLRDPIATSARIEELRNDGKGFEDRVKEVIGTTLGPGMTRNLEGQAKMALGKVEEAFDAQFGAGFFLDKIKPTLTGDKGTLKAFNLFEQADVEIVGAAARGALGNVFMDNEGRTDLMERMDKVKTDREAQPARNMMGPGLTPSRNPDHITPDIRAGILSIQQKLGKDAFDETKWRQAVKNGGDGELWQADFTKERKASAGAAT